MYFTATVDDAGTLNLHGDLYGMDGRVASALAGKPIAFAAAKPDGTAQPKRQQTGRGQSGRAKEPVSSYNPFAGLFGN